MAWVENTPRFAESEVRQLARAWYGVAATAIRPLPGERDQNFQLTGADGAVFVFKVANPADGEAVLELQNQALRHLAGRGGAMCPQVCPTLSGDLMVTVQDAQGTPHRVRLLTYLPGQPLAHYAPHSPELLAALGRFLGELDRALADFSHPAAHREFYWDAARADQVIERYLHAIDDPGRRAIVEHFLDQFRRVAPTLARLRRSVIHSDANDYNVLVESVGVGQARIAGLVDFGDMVHSCTVCEVAIAAAYAMLDKPNPVAAAAQVVAGYHSVYPLTEPEIECLYPLMGARLCLTVTLAAYQQQLNPGNAYLAISETPAWTLLERLVGVNPRFAHYVFRGARGLAPCAATARVVEWLANNRDTIGPVLDADWQNAVVLDLSVGSARAGVAHTGWRGQCPAVPETGVAVGRHDEARWFPAEDGPALDRRTIHLGMELFVAAGTPVLAPLDGEVIQAGATVILKHAVAGGEVVFYTLYRPLRDGAADGLREGMAVHKGQIIGSVGEGGGSPRLHFQIVVDRLDCRDDFPQFCAPDEREVWRSLCPDPNLILGIPPARFPPAGFSKAQILHLRERHISRALSIAYRRPLKIARGYRQYLYDDEGRAYLDAVNNVPHVGHCHPRVVAAAQEQIAVLNTNTRYLHPYLVEYAERLCATLPDELSVCFFVCTGSEANDLALRLARTHTGHTDVIVLDSAYHGNLSSLIDISPYKFDGPGGQGAPARVQKVPTPDPYRGHYKGYGAETGAKYAECVRDAAATIRRRGRGVAAFYCESLPGCGGQIVLPDQYLAEAFRHVREAGGVCVADEVQVGFGRVGTHFWGFETQGVVPDIVTLGKPIGNGHPLAAVITRPEIAASFHNGMEYFNTFGGNPVSCAVGLAVLDVIQAEKLQENAREVGAQLLAGLAGLQEKYALVGDARGLGLYIGVELVLDRDTLAPAAEHTACVVERMKESGILISLDGPFHNVLKIKPPLVFTKPNAEALVAALDHILAEDSLQV